MASGRIPDLVVQDLISRTDLGTLIGESVALKRTGHNLTGLCPFHEEKTPSFTVSPVKNFYYCFGCGASGNAISFLMDYQHMSFVSACENLASKLGIPIQYENGTYRKQHKVDDILYQAIQIAETFFRETLTSLPEHHPVVKYLKKRNITERSQAQFGIGFAPAGWESLKNHLQQHHISEKTALEIGLLTQGKSGKVYDRFRARLMFPIRDATGKTIAFGGRVLNDEQPKYLNSPESEVFQKRQALFGLSDTLKAGKLNKILITEGYLDVIRMHQVGLPYAVAALGTATSEHHIKTLFRVSDQVIACFDGDSAGVKAAWRLLENSLGIIQSHQKINFLFLPSGQDPDSFIAEHGKNSFLAEEQKSKGLSEFFIDKLTEDLQLHQLDDRAKLLKRALPLVKSIDKSLLQDLLLQKLSDISQLPVERLVERMNGTESIKAVSQEQNSVRHQSHRSPDQSYQILGPGIVSDHQKQWPNKKKPYKNSKWKSYSQHNDFYSDKKTPLPRSQNLIDAMLRLLLQQPELARQSSLELDTEPQIKGFSLFQETYNQLRHNPEASPGYLMGLWHNEPQGDHIAKLAAEEFLIPQQSLDIEFSDGLRQIQALALNEALAQTARAKPLDKDRLKKLLEKKQILEQQKASSATVNTP